MRKPTALRTITTKAIVVLLLVGTKAVAGTDSVPAQIAPDPVPPDPRVVISIPDRKLLLIEDGEVVKVYPVTVGRPGSPSPAGTFTIATRAKDPAWNDRDTGRIVPPGKHNPLGTRWLGLSRPRYGIHGTNAPGSIGRAASRGCIRMHNNHVEELFRLLDVGDIVELRRHTLDQLRVYFRFPDTETEATLAASSD